MKTNPPHHRRGFTMIELLVVVMVIGILAAILLPALTGAIRRARITVVAMEISQLESAVEAYKAANAGEYPPDGFNFGTNANSSASPPTADAYAATNVENHLRRIYPRKTITINTSNWTTGSGGLQRTTNFGQSNPNFPNAYFGNMDPAEALCFWLSMVFANPSDPLTNGTATGANNGTLKSYFDFDQGRFRDRDNDGWPEYYPKHGSDSPYVYFHNQTYSAAAAGGSLVIPFASGVGTLNPTGSIASSYYTPLGGSRGTARPYLTAVIGNPAAPAGGFGFANPTRFQIIWAGMDSSFSSTPPGDPGVANKFFPNATLKIPMMAAITLDDRDNVTNFSEGRTLEDNRP